MSNASPSNVAASVKQRLLNRARSRKEDFNLLLTKYALERMLYRISQSRHRESFVLKGALLFELWTEQAHRPTRGQTALPRTALPAALSPDFYDDKTKQKQWNAFVMKNKLHVEAISLREVMTGIGEFILPIVQAEAPAILTWNPGGPWKNSTDQA